MSRGDRAVSLHWRAVKRIPVEKEEEEREEEEEEEEETGDRAKAL